MTRPAFLVYLRHNVLLLSILNTYLDILNILISEIQMKIPKLLNTIMCTKHQIPGPFSIYPETLLSNPDAKISLMEGMLGKYLQSTLFI